jgi:hypothetical protein
MKTTRIGPKVFVISLGLVQQTADLAASVWAALVAAGPASSTRRPKTSRIGVGRFLAVAILGLIVMGVQEASAANRYVATSGSDVANNCTNQLMPCMTIQHAINQASPNDTINVVAGLYPEPAAGPLTVNKTLTLLGAQATVDARTRVGAESVVTDPQGTSVSASDVVIDGFTFQDSISTAFTGYGIWLNPGISGTQILNNIIQDNIVGIGLANSGVSQAVIRHNWIRKNTRPGAASGSGIYTDQFSGGATVRDVWVDENAFTDHAGFGAAINISNTNFANGVFNLEVSSNLFDKNSRAFVLFNTHDSTFLDNLITNSTFVASADVRLFDNNTGLLFENNDLRGGVGHAIRFSIFLATPSSDVEFHQNNIEVYALTGLTVDAGSHVGTVNAECNWWNSPSGPTNPNNPGGTGEEVVGDADFTPWLTAPAPGGPCAGPVPSGMVTGGGQINVTSGRGSFGFNAKNENGVASGHLNYKNHASGAHLDCTVTTMTQLTTTMAKFEGTCSSKSSASSFMAEVEDNQEPGKNADKFTIKYGTVTVTDGGTIRSGNIQIHKTP